MKYLLDSHTLIWLITNQSKLSKNVKKIIENTETEIYASAINFWEISVKYSLGKLTLLGGTPEDLYESLKYLDIPVIPLNAEETKTFYHLKANYHRDPFDKMLIWQAISEKYTLITCDENIIKYKTEGLKTLW